MKTNKSYTKRLRVTKKGKIIGRTPGINHFNAKSSRRRQLAQKRGAPIILTNQAKRRFLPGA